MNITYHKAAIDDAHEIAVLHNQCVRIDYKGQIPDEYIEIPVTDVRVKAWSGWIERSHVSTIVAKEDSNIIGFCTLQPNFSAKSALDSADLVGIFVLKSYRNQGVGTALHQRILTEAKQRGFEKLVYWDLESNDSARKFYESLGYHQTSNKRVFLELSARTLYETEYLRLS